VVNSAGQVLDWVLSFQSHESILKFLDHSKARYEKYSKGAAKVATQRFMNFPARQLPDIADRGIRVELPEHVRDEDVVSSFVVRQAGAMLGRVFGRAMGPDGNPMADTSKQENYVEDRFEVSREIQEGFVKVAEAEGDRPFVLSAEMARALVGNAFLGQLDVNPLGGREVAGVIKSEDIRFEARLIESGKVKRYALVGRSQVAGANSRDGNPSKDGRSWSHEVSLAWEGYLEFRAEGSQIMRIELLADGFEKLRWSNGRGANNQKLLVAQLPSGRLIDLSAPVRYGVVVDAD
jgi:hypothetical protein